MIPISACGKRPPFRDCCFGKLVIIQEGVAAIRAGDLRDDAPPCALRVGCDFAPCRLLTPCGECQTTIFMMRALVAASLLLLLGESVYTQEKPASAEAPSAVTVAAVIDHNRITIPAEVRLPDGSTQTVRAWVDNGTPDLYLSRRLATVLGLKVICAEKECSSPAPGEMAIGGMRIPLSDVKAARIPLRAVEAAQVMAAGMNAEINLPANVLRHYDVLVDFPEHRFSIGMPGTIHFLGSSSKVQVDTEGLIEVPSQIGRKKYNLVLDLGASISFLSDDLFAQLATANADWPRMTGAVGPANTRGADEEADWEIMRIDRVQVGPIFLTDVPFVSLSKPAVAPAPSRDSPKTRAGAAVVGRFGSEKLTNYRIGIDYAHSMVYFDIGRLFSFPDFDVVGLVLRPEDDGHYTVLAVAGMEGKPSVDGVQPGDRLEAVNDIEVRGATMGQVWSMLGGTPGQEKKLTLKRGQKEFTVMAEIQHFLAESLDQNETKKKK